MSFSTSLFLVRLFENSIWSLFGARARSFRWPRKVIQPAAPAAGRSDFATCSRLAAG